MQVDQGPLDTFSPGGSTSPMSDRPGSALTSPQNVNTIGPEDQLDAAASEDTKGVSMKSDDQGASDAPAASAGPTSICSRRPLLVKTRAQKREKESLLTSPKSLKARRRKHLMTHHKNRKEHPPNKALMPQPLLPRMSVMPD